MQITKTKSGDDTMILTLNGRLDASTANDLKDSLLSALDVAENVTLDFAQLSYISSAGLRVLLTGQKAAASNGASMTVANIAEDVMEVIKMTGFDKLLKII